MLDMSFQLLSFFLITFRPMPTEGQLAIHLPRTGVSPDDPSVVRDPLDQPTDEYTITVYAGPDGGVALLGLRGPAVNSDDIPSVAELLGRLKAIPRPGGDPKAVAITIESAGDLKYLHLIEVMDACKRAGYESVNLTPLAKARG